MAYDFEPATWECLEDRVIAFIEAHPEIDDINDVIEALVWGQEDSNADE